VVRGLGKDREIGAPAVIGRAQRVGRARPDVHTTSVGPRCSPGVPQPPGGVFVSSAHGHRHCKAAPGDVDSRHGLGQWP
jgi:hypothetical protein